MKKASLILLAMVLMTITTSQAQTTSKIDGVVFADYGYNLENNAPAEKDRNSFQFRRIYFTYENNISEAIKVRFRLESESNAYGSTSKINPFVKHAYIE